MFVALQNIAFPETCSLPAIIDEACSKAFNLYLVFIKTVCG